MGPAPSSYVRPEDRSDVPGFIDRSLFQVTLLTLLFAALFASHPPADLDLFHRVAVGRLVEATGGVVDVDPFSFTEKHDRWVDHEWLSGVVFYQAVKAWGDGGLLVVTLLTLLATAALVSRAQRVHQGGATGTFTWFFLTMVVASRAWGSMVRSQSFTFAGLAVQLWALAEWRAGRRRWIWVLPLAYIPWANFHGGFVAGLGLLGAAIVAISIDRRDRFPRDLWLCLVACVLVSLLNPYGLTYWRYLASALTMDRPAVLEWSPLPLTSFWGGLAVLFAAIFVLGAFRAKPRPPPEAWALALVSFLAAVQSRRFLSIFVLTVAVYGTPSFQALLGPFRRRLVSGRPFLRAVGHAAVIVLTLVTTQQAFTRLSNFSRQGVSFERFPVEAIEWLETRGGGDLLVHFNHGSYALWRLFPRYRVSVDGRYEEVYPQETVDRVMTALDPEAEGHVEALQWVNPDYILVEGDGSGFGPEWHTVYADSRAVVLSRDSLPPPRDPGADERPMWVPGF